MTKISTKKAMRKNPQIDRGFYYGEIKRIAELSGFSESMVRKVLVYELRKNTKISEVANKLKESYQSLQVAS